MTLFCCLGLARFAFGMLLPGMREGLLLAYDQMGFLGTGNFVGYLFSVAITPPLLKQLRPRATIVLGLVIIAVSLTAKAQCDSYLPLLVLYLLTGSGSGLANIATMVLIAHWFRREKRGRAAGLMVLGNGVGIIFSGMLIPILNQYYGPNGWRASWSLLGGITLVIALVVAFIVRNAPEDLGLEPVGKVTPLSNDELRGRNTDHQSRAILSLGLLYLAFGATYMVYGTFVVTTIVEEYGFSEATAGQFWSWVGFFGLFSGVLFGGLSDRIGRKGGFTVVFLIQTLAYLLVGSGIGGWTLWLSVFLYGIVAFAIPAIMTAAVSDYLGIAKAAAGFSFITFFFAGGQTVGPAIAGLIAQHSGSFAPAYLISAAMTFLAMIICLTLPSPDHRGSEIL